MEAEEYGVEESARQLKRVKKQLESCIALKARVDSGELTPNEEQKEKIKKLTKLQKEYDSLTGTDKKTKSYAEVAAAESESSIQIEKEVGAEEYGVEESARQLKRVKKQLESCIALKARVDSGELAPNEEQKEKIKKLTKLQKEYDSLTGTDKKTKSYAEAAAAESSSLEAVPKEEGFLVKKIKQLLSEPEITMSSAPPAQFTHYTQSVKAKCEQCQRPGYLDCISDDRTGALYCLRCWADFLTERDVTCGICKRAKATLRDPAAKQSECRQCYRRRLQKATKKKGAKGSQEEVNLGEVPLKNDKEGSMGVDVRVTRTATPVVSETGIKGGALTGAGAALIMCLVLYLGYRRFK